MVAEKKSVDTKASQKETPADKKDEKKKDETVTKKDGKKAPVEEFEDLVSFR